MPRLTFATTAGLLIAASIHITAQQPSGLDTAAASKPRVASATKGTPQKMLPGTRPNALSVIQGNALNSTDGKLTSAIVRLRDARFGQIVATQMTDSSGLFTFPMLDPGSYIVEIIGPDESTVLAASQVVSVAAGEVMSAVVKLPFQITAASGLLGSTGSLISVITAQAASAGLMATQASGAQTCVTLRP